MGSGRCQRHARSRALPAVEIGAPLDRLAPDSLEPVFTTKVRRRTQRLELPGAVIEAAFDEGTIEAGTRREPLTEIEFEVKAETRAPSTTWARRLLDIAPLRIGTLSKSDRGYALAFDMEPEATKAKPPDVTANGIRSMRRSPRYLAIASTMCWRTRSAAIAACRRACIRCASHCAACARRARC